LQSAIVSVVGDDFPQEYLDLLLEKKYWYFWWSEVVKEKTFFWSGRP
jgi:hypothetical protein